MTLAILVFDISKRDSFSNIEKWLKEIKEHCESKTSLILVGNKSDRSASRVVSLEESKAFAGFFKYLILNFYVIFLNSNLKKNI